MSQPDMDAIRQHERQAIDLPAEFEVCPEHREQVRFSAAASTSQSHIIQGRVVDLSMGGLGFICEQFLPRMCRGTVRVFDPASVNAAEPGTPIFKHDVKIFRVSLIRQPLSYSMGTGFVDPAPHLMKRIKKLLKRFSNSQASSQGGGNA